MVVGPSLSLECAVGEDVFIFAQLSLLSALIPLVRVGLVSCIRLFSSANEIRDAQVNWLFILFYFFSSKSFTVVQCLRVFFSSSQYPLFYSLLLFQRQKATKAVVNALERIAMLY